MNKRITKSELFKIVAENINVDIQRITEDSSLKEDLACDSIDMLEILFDIEEFLEVDFSEDEFMQVKYVHEIIDFLKSKKLYQEI